ncbi:hypothetical protein DM860_013604 [Cuscuta australis]|uniref:Uncharacterized protein n=1 Tax=Cuscuta australis TaxID=267555 RepID=A0A328EE00_9ASTE|nr:hypothetical protein DM860_013604 [Cuscuta australis]
MTVVFNFELRVVGVPITINGDLQNRFVETNVGFDTICKMRAWFLSIDATITTYSAKSHVWGLVNGLAYTNLTLPRKVNSQLITVCTDQRRS